MHETLSLLILIIGGIIAANVLIEAGLAKLRLPAMIGFLVLGFLLRLVSLHYDFLAGSGEDIFDFLAKLGIFLLSNLFQALDT